MHAVLCYKNVPRVVYSTAGQSYPAHSGPLDYVNGEKVRYVGDRVAALRQSPRSPKKPLALIRVDYEVFCRQP